MEYRKITENIKTKKTFLCIGLDTDVKKIPESVLKYEDPVFEFNKQIIDATHDLTLAYKPNTAFYESTGIDGWKSLQKTITYIKTKYPDIFVIADAKRGDIGNTSAMYAKAFFDNMNFDAITVAPYMGKDSVSPFLEYNNKWVILLALTSNTGAYDFQFIEDKNERKLFENVIEKSKTWANENKLMYVVGATKAEMLQQIRKIIPQHFLLVPGVGAQGGSLQDVAKYGINKNCGLIVNSSRGIIYAGKDENFANAARQKTKEIQQEMNEILLKYNVI